MITVGACLFCVIMALGFILYLRRIQGYSQAVMREFPGAFTKVRSDADFNIGKPGEEIPEGVATACYKRNRIAGTKYFRCEQCSARCVRGVPNGFWEKLLVQVGYARVGNVDHTVAKKIGGKASRPEYVRLLCQPCNLRKLDRVTRATAQLCIAQGWKILFTRDLKF